MTDSTNVNTVQKQVDKGGRPTELSDKIVQDLEAAFQRGLSVGKACEYAKVPRSTYYYWCDNIEGFLDKMTSAKNLVLLDAADNVVNHIRTSKDINSSWKWLEKKDPDAFAPRSLVAVQNNQINNNQTYVKATPNEVNRRFEELFGGADTVSDEQPTEGSSTEQTT